MTFLFILSQWDKQNLETFLWFPRAFLQILLKFLTMGEIQAKEQVLGFFFFLDQGIEKVSVERMHNSGVISLGCSPKGLCDPFFLSYVPSIYFSPLFKTSLLFHCFKKMEAHEFLPWSPDTRILLLLLLSLEIWIWTIIVKVRSSLPDAQWLWATLNYLGLLLFYLKNECRNHSSLSILKK